MKGQVDREMIHIPGLPEGSPLDRLAIGSRGRLEAKREAGSRRSARAESACSGLLDECESAGSCL